MIPRKWSNRRFLVQLAAFLLLVVTPLLNFYAHWTFLQGWYQSFGIGDLWIVSPLEGLESLLITREPFGPLLVSVLPPIFLALMLGRVFCSWACPISFLSELSDRILNLFRRSKSPRKDVWKLAKQILWVALGLELAASLMLGAPIFVFLSPPGLVGRELMMWIFFRTLALEGVIIVVVLLLNLITRRFYCRYLCPLGGLLAFIGRWRHMRIHRDTGKPHCGACDQACPMGIRPSQDEGQSAYCWNCGTCVDTCPHGQLKFRWYVESRPSAG